MESEDKSCFMNIDLTNTIGLSWTHIEVDQGDVTKIQHILRKGSRLPEFPATIGPLFNLIDCVQEPVVKIQEQETVSKTPVALYGSQEDIFINEWEIEYVTYVQFLITKGHVKRNKSSDITVIDSDCDLSLMFFIMRDGSIKAANIGLVNRKTFRVIKVKPRSLILKEGGLSVLNSAKASIKA